MSRIPLVAVALAALVGCGPEEVACDLMAVSSVNLTVVDAAGAAFAGATAVYSVDGAAPVACDDMGGGAFVCGYEVAGEFLVVVSAPNYETAEGTVTVEADECHVISEALTVTLDELACTDIALPSMEVTVAGSSGEALTGVAVTYAPDGGDDAAACEGGGADWVCGIEEAGDFVVVASADGHTTEVQNVTVEADECHVFTEQVAFELDWLPD